MTELSTAPSLVAPWRLFPAEVVRLHRLSPSFLRVTFTGDDFDTFADPGYDQRIKLVFPVPEHGFRHLPQGTDWYQRWRALPTELRNPFRTYTTRAVRREAREVDVDIVLHPDGGPYGAHGPAARWAFDAAPGDRIVIMGPDHGYLGDHGGREFQPALASRTLLLVGDETAVPAIAAIVERLPAHSRGEVLLEVPEPADVLDLPAPPLVTVSWLPRSGAAHGSLLVPAVRAAAERLLPTDRPAPRDASDEAVDDELWEVPVGLSDGGHYAWLAGESGVIRTLRRYLVSERGLDRESVAFMGYWRLGKADDAA
ncbi:NADPH-dependent ferric siderophore reductase [Plantactinospora sp. BC1]|uniref:siderophore-interacting protein n=1 Tax=Plantactinospora sp. BC1 TaxID=2108470 RepID=UPI000D159D83|nr:siderophore-interacting protein [Plantactinospora sp. BC1]AVT30669.1 NADPH-dependent ferric siderophore reductase [Plantactinospora sp. BC1]